MGRYSVGGADYVSGRRGPPARVDLILFRAPDRLEEHRLPSGLGERSRSAHHAPGDTSDAKADRHVVHGLVSPGYGVAVAADAPGQPSGRARRPAYALAMTDEAPHRRGAAALGRQLQGIREQLESDVAEGCPDEDISLVRRPAWVRKVMGPAMGVVMEGWWAQKT